MADRKEGWLAESSTSIVTVIVEHLRVETTGAEPKIP